MVVLQQFHMMYSFGPVFRTTNENQTLCPRNKRFIDVEKEVLVELIGRYNIPFWAYVGWMTCEDKYQVTNYYNLTIEAIQRGQIGSWATYFTNGQMLHIHAFMAAFTAEHAVRQAAESADEFYAKINQMEQIATSKMHNQMQPAAAMHTQHELTEPIDVYNEEIQDDPDRETVVDEEEFYDEDEQRDLREERIGKNHQ